MKTALPILIIIIGLLAASCGENNLLPGGSGLIESTEVIVSAETAGKLEAIRFLEGDPINAGDTIGMIDTITVSLRLRQAQALKQAALTQLNVAALNREQSAYNFDLATKEYDRMMALIKSGSVNQQQYDRAENAYNLAGLAKKQADAAVDAARADLKKIEAEIALLEKQMNDCFPTAPIKGIVTDKFIDTGELVGVGAPFIKISRLDTVWIKVYLPPADLSKIKFGGQADIDPEDNGDIMHGTITWISSSAEFTPKNIQTKEARADLVYAVKITIANPDERLKIGMPVSVTIP
ncbi:MAG: efflux RND transporter periplasmic adaptor subunit [Candidatus Zixiibacteriota bacterium]